MSRIDTLLKLKKEKLVAVIRGKDEEQVLKTCDAVVAGGINILEITFTIPHAEVVIAKAVEKYKGNKDVSVGAGTVLDIVAARLAISAGADFVVCPHLDKEIMELCNQYKVAVFPGAVTITDMVKAMRYGAEVIKLFPGDITGPKGIKAFKGPLPHVELMPTGGVSVDNVQEWLKNGAYAVGCGGITKGADTGDFDKVTKDTKEMVEKVKELMEKKA